MSLFIMFNSKTTYGAQPCARNCVAKETHAPYRERLAIVSRSSERRRKQGLFIILPTIGVAIKVLIKSHENRGEGVPNSQQEALGSLQPSTEGKPTLGWVGGSPSQLTAQTSLKLNESTSRQ